MEAAYTNYEFNTAASLLYDFFWGNYCNLYLETIKGDTSPSTLATMDTVLRRFLILLHPLMPHITEELWITMGYGTEGTFLMQTQVPTTSVLAGISPEAVATAQTRANAIYSTAYRARNLKSEYNLGTNRNVTLLLKPTNDWVAGEINVLRILVGAAEIKLDGNFSPPTGTPAALTDVGEIHLPLEGFIDLDAERARLEKEHTKITEDLAKAKEKLASPSFADRAPPAGVVEFQQRITDFSAKLQQLEQLLSNLQR